MQAMLTEGFPFHQFNVMKVKATTYDGQFLVNLVVLEVARGRHRGDAVLTQWVPREARHRMLLVG